MNIQDLAGLLEERGRVNVTGPTTNLYVLTEREAAENIQGIVGTGKVVKAYNQYRYNLSRVPDVYYVLKAVLPHFETDALSYEFEVVEARFENLTHGSRNPRTYLAPHAVRPAIDEETKQRVRQIFKNKLKYIGADKLFKGGRVNLKTPKKHAKFLQSVFGGIIHTHKLRKVDDGIPQYTWRLTRKDDVARLREVLGV